MCLVKRDVTGLEWLCLDYEFWRAAGFAAPDFSPDRNRASDGVRDVEGRGLIAYGQFRLRLTSWGTIGTDAEHPLRSLLVHEKSPPKAAISVSSGRARGHPPHLDQGEARLKRVRSGIQGVSVGRCAVARVSVLLKVKACALTEKVERR